MSRPGASRVTGFMLGSLLVLGAFAMVMHDSQMSEPRSPVVNVQQSIAEPNRNLPDIIKPVEAEELPDNTVADTLRSARATTAQQLELNPQTWNRATEHYASSERREMAGLSRFPVWSPFRSQWAAQGFARRLALTTDVPVEVVNDSPGVYQVVIRYRDDTERRATVRHIESVTGLEIAP